MSDYLIAKLRKSEAILSDISQFFGQRIPADDFKEAESLQVLFTGYVLRLEAALAEAQREITVLTVMANSPVDFNFIVEKCAKLEAMLAEKTEQLDEFNGILGELTNTPSGAIIESLRGQLAEAEKELASWRNGLLPLVSPGSEDHP